MDRMLRSGLIFTVVAILHFALSVAGIAMILPAGFESQGQGFWAAPGKLALVWISSVLLAPLAWVRGSDFGFGHIALASVLFGAAAVGIARLSRAVARRS